MLCMILQSCSVLVCTDTLPRSIRVSVANAFLASKATTQPTVHSLPVYRLCCTHSNAVCLVRGCCRGPDYVGCFHAAYSRRLLIEPHYPAHPHAHSVNPHPHCPQLSHYLFAYELICCN